MKDVKYNPRSISMNRVATDVYISKNITERNENGNSCNVSSRGAWESLNMMK